MFEVVQVLSAHARRGRKFCCELRIASCIFSVFLLRPFRLPNTPPIPSSVVLYALLSYRTIEPISASWQLRFTKIAASIGFQLERNSRRAGSELHVSTSCGLSQ